MGAIEKEKEKRSYKSKGKFLCMDIEMIPCKLTFLLGEAGCSAGWAFASLYYLSFGLTVAQLGIAGAVGCIVSLVASPMVGGIVDNIRKNRALFMMILVLACTLNHFAIPWVLMALEKRTEITHCPSNETSANSSLDIRHLGHNCTSKTVLSNPYTLVAAITVNGFISSIMFSGQLTFVESAITKTVYSRDKTYTYGQQKGFAPLGNALGNFLAGFGVDHYSPSNKNLSPYLASYYIYLPINLLIIPFLYIVTKQADWDYGKEKENPINKSVFRRLRKEVKKPDVAVFLLSVIMSGTSLCVYFHYYYIYMNDVMHPTKTMLSITTVVAYVTEVFLYPFTARIIKAFGGPIRCIILGIAGNSLRLLLLTFITKPWHALFIQPLHALGLCLSWAAMIEHTWAIFPKEITSTAIGLLACLLWAIPSIIASLGGGYLYHIYGGALVFQGMAGIGVVWCIFMFFYYETRRKSDKDSNTKADIDLEPDPKPDCIKNEYTLENGV